jgi:surface polysaccharide O-acyltransferase-like enzyme
MIPGLYLATPILRVYVRSASRSNLTYFLIVWFITVSVLPIIKRFTGIEIGIDIVVTTQYVGFFILGHYLRDVTVPGKRVLPLLMLIVGSLIFTQIITNSLTRAMDGTFDNFFVLNDSFNLVIAAVCLFIFLKSLDYDRIFRVLPFLRTIIMWISTCSLGIYFIHVMIIELLASGRLGFKLDALAFQPLLAIPLTSILVMGLSILFVSLLQRIPIVRNIVP